MNLPIGLATIVVLGAAAQWVGWRMRLPSILLLLVSGFLVGPQVAGLVDPDAFGALLLPFVSLSVAVILFEGALTLELRELGEHRGVVGRLITLGAAITWMGAALLGWLLLGLGPVLAVLVGAILVVTGPTVVLPLLRQVRPAGGSGSILKWEGILIDPVGAVLAVLVFEGIAAGGGLRPALGLAALGILKTILIGGGIGVAAALLLLLVLRRYWVPDDLHSPVALSMAVGAYALANLAQHEAGLLTVTVMGALLANQRRVDVSHILEFKENLRVLVISAVFILLAARIDPGALRAVDWRIALFVAGLVLVVRPLAVAACTAGSGLDRRTRLFLAGLAPRGVVAAAVASVFALRLEALGHPGAGRIVPIVFVVVIGTVAIYGLGAGPLAFRLGLAKPAPQGVLIIGAHRFGRELAAALRGLGILALLVDTNARRIARARLAGLPAWHGSAVGERADEHLDLAGIGRLFALTSNDEINSLCVVHYAPVFGRGEVYQLPPAGDVPAARLRGRVLFSAGWEARALNDRLAAGAAVKATKLTEQFGLAEWRAEHGPEALPLLTVDEDGRVTVVAADQPLAPSPGDTLVGLA